MAKIKIMWKNKCREKWRGIGVAEARQLVPNKKVSSMANWLKMSENKIQKIQTHTRAQNEMKKSRDMSTLSQ